MVHVGRWRVGASAIATLLLSTASACPLATYQCSDDVQCPRGTCIDDACAFVDDGCPSGMRFGAHTAGGQGGACVPVTDGTSAAEAVTGPASSSSTSIDVLGTSSSSTAATTEGSTTPVASTTTAAAAESSSTGGPGEPDLVADLVAWFPCEGEGPAIGADASGNGHDGVCLDCPTSALGVVGQACQFEPGQFITVPFDPAFAVDAFTLAAWILPEALPEGQLMSAASVPVGPGTANAYQFGFNGLGGGQRVFFCHGSPKGQECLNETVMLTDWMHLAVTSSAEVTRIYVDGALIREEPTIPPAYDMQDFLIGVDVDAGEYQHGFVGLIDELRVYARALSDDEIVDLAAQGSR